MNAQTDCMLEIVVTKLIYQTAILTSNGEVKMKIPTGICEEILHIEVNTIVNCKNLTFMQRMLQLIMHQRKAAAMK